MPEPKRGQPEYELFRELTGKDWDAYADLEFDPETKITEFDYENYLNPELLKNIDTNTDEFKQFVRALNFTTKTQYEQHQANKKKFSQLNMLLSGLDADQQRALIHLIRNKRAGCADGQELTNDLMDSVTDESFIKELAEVHEKENFALKNRYMHQKNTMNFAEKKRMPIDESSVRELLRNQHIFRDRASRELPTYTAMQENSQFEHGLLTYLREGAYGDLGELVKEVGIKRDTIPFFNM